MKIPPSLYKTAAVFSCMSAFTTLVLILAPRFVAPGDGFEARMLRVHDGWYLFRAWAYLLHPFITGAAALAVCLRVRASATALAIIGAAGCALWAFTEAAQQCLTLFAFDKWRIAYLAGDPVIRTQMQTLTTIYDGAWDALYVLLLIGFMIGETHHVHAQANPHRGCLGAIAISGFSRDHKPAIQTANFLCLISHWQAIA